MRFDRLCTTRKNTRSLLINPYSTLSPSPHNTRPSPRRLTKSHLPLLRIKRTPMDERPCRSGEKVGCDALAAVGGGYEEARDA